MLYNSAFCVRKLSTLLWEQIFFIFTRQVQGIWRGKKLHINLNLISKGQVKPMNIGYLLLYTSSKKYLLWGKRGVDLQLWQQRGASLQNEVRHQTCSVRQHQFTLVVKTLKIISKDCPSLLLASSSDGNVPLMHSRQKAFYGNHSVCCHGSKKRERTGWLGFSYYSCVGLHSMATWGSHRVFWQARPLGTSSTAKDKHMK